MPTEQNLEQAHLFILRRKFGQLRAWNTYMPSILRKQYLELLDEIAKEFGL